MAHLRLIASLAGASGVSGLASAGIPTPTVWAEYMFENSLSDVSGNGHDLSVGSGSSSRWSPVFVTGRVGQAVHLDSHSGSYADSSNSWLQGPVISGADIERYFEMWFHIALVDKGYLHGENILTFQAKGDTTDLASLLTVTAGANASSEFHFLGQTILSAGSVFDSAWHTVKLSSSNPCDASPTWDLIFDGKSYTSGPYGGASICGRQLLMNRHCWSGGLSCASRVNMKVDEMVIRSAAPRLAGASTSGASGAATATSMDAEKRWVCALKSDATAEQVERVSKEFEGGTNSGHFVAGSLTVDGVNEVRAKYPVLVVTCDEDPFTQKAWERPIQDNSSLRRRTYPWGITDINADVVRGRGVGVNVYVLDTGIRTTHVEFGGRAFAGVDMSSNWLNVCPSGSTTCAADVHGHGTHCAGTVGASTYGVADGATLWALKVLDDNGNGFTWWSIALEQWVLGSGARPAVVSMSLGGPTLSTSEQISIDGLVADGVTVVVAAGNDNMDACSFNPAWIPSAITVASYAQGGAKSGFSNYGSCVDVWAPGSNILSTYPGSDTSLGWSSGTSMACPHVSGLAAIMYHENSGAESMTALQRWNLLTASQRTGYVTGIPTTPATVNLIALAPTPTPSATPNPTPNPTSPGASAVGDPHLQNIIGERFDLMKAGKHVLINIPRGQGADQALLRVQARASRLGGHCADMYFQELNVTGSWAEAKQAGGYHYSVWPYEIKIPEWVALGKVELKVVHGLTDGGLRYLNLYVKHLGRAGFAVGGLLGEDDHGDVITPPEACVRRLSLVNDMVEDAKRKAPQVFSVAEASLA